MLPSEGYKILEPPASYVPDTHARAEAASRTPAPYGGATPGGAGGFYQHSRRRIAGQDFDVAGDARGFAGDEAGGRASTSRRLLKETEEEEP